MSVNSSSFTNVSNAEKRERMETVALFSFFGTWGVILNAFPIFLMFTTHRIRKNLVNVIVANLSVADFLFSLSFVFGQTQYILYREDLPETGCHWLAFITFTAAIQEFILPPVLSANRYISFYHNHYYDKVYTRTNTVLMIAGGWLISVCIPLIFVLYGKVGFDDDNQHCCILVKNDTAWTVFYWFVIIIPLICGCNGCMMFFNYKIYAKLSDHSQLNGMSKNVVRQNRELLYFFVADMLFPICFHTVYHVCKFAISDRNDTGMKRLFTTLYLINSCLRGLVTLVTLRPYRNALRRIMGCKRVDYAFIRGSNKKITVVITSF